MNTQITTLNVQMQLQAKAQERAVIEQKMAEYVASGGEIRDVQPRAVVNEKLAHGTRQAYVIAACRCGQCLIWSNKNRLKGGRA